MTVPPTARHDAGLAQFHEPITVDDVNNQHDLDGNLSRIIAAQEPWTFQDGPDKGTTPVSRSADSANALYLRHEAVCFALLPCSDQGAARVRGGVPQRIYHAISRGYVLSQILLRVDPLRRTVGEWFSQELCGPLGAAFFCGPSDPRYADKPEAAMVRPERPYLFANGMVPQAVRAALPEKFPVRCPCPVLLLLRPAVPCPVLSVAAATSCSSIAGVRRCRFRCEDWHGAGGGDERGYEGGDGAAPHEQPTRPPPDVRAGNLEGCLRRLLGRRWGGASVPRQAAARFPLAAVALCAVISGT